MAMLSPMMMLAAASTATAARHVPTIAARNGGLYVDGQPFAPAGYCNHAHLQGQGRGSRSYEIEVTEGFNSIFTYRGLPGEGEGRWGNESWTDTMAFLDRCAEVGIKVLFDFSQNAMLDTKAPPPLEVIKDAVTRLRDHPAILSWYLIDEPDGRQYPPSWVASASALIRSIDSKRPVSMCFDTTNRPGGTWPLYVNATDVVLADIYPTGSMSAACTPANGCNITKSIGDSIRQAIAATGKTTWFVPQAFGSQEAYQREPSVGEARIMVYSALLAGATGTFAFTREDSDRTPPVVDAYLHVGTSQPRSSFMWSEFRRLAIETTEMAPWIISSRPRPKASASLPGVDTGAFIAEDGSMLLVAANILGDPLPSVRLSVNTSAISSDGSTSRVGAPPPATARVLFATGYREVGVTRAADGSWSLTDTMDALSTRVYLFPPPADQPAHKHPRSADATSHVLPTPTIDPLAPNLIFNGGFEFATSAGVADGWMAQWGGDGAATQAQDSSVVRAGGGRHSLRLTTPTAATQTAPASGQRAWSFPVKADMVVGAAYYLAFWARGGEEAQALTIGFEALFGEAKALCPSGRHAQCSYTPQTFNLKLNEWTHHELSATCRFQPDKTGYYGAAGMVSLELLGAGAAWVDDVVLTLKNNTKSSAYQ